METKTPPPDEYLAQRSAELDRIEASLLEKLKWLHSERNRIQRMAQSAGISPSAVEIHQSKQVEHAVISRTVAVPQSGTIKAAAIEALKKAANGLSAQEMLPLINRTLGTDYPRSSLSPQLSRLKQDGLITLKGGVWRVLFSSEMVPTIAFERNRQGPSFRRHCTTVKPVEEAVHDDLN